MSLAGTASALLAKYATADKCLSYTRFCLPIVLHCLSICFMDILYMAPKAIPPDYGTLLFTITASEFFVRLDALHAEDVDIPHHYIDNFFKITLSCLYTDLALRFLWIPAEYIIYYLCMHGLTRILLKTIYPLVPKYFSKYFDFLINMAETEKGCKTTTDLVATFLFITVLARSSLFGEILKAIKWLLEKIWAFMLHIWEFLKQFSKRPCWLF